MGRAGGPGEAPSPALALEGQGPRKAVLGPLSPQLTFNARPVSAPGASLQEPLTFYQAGARLRVRGEQGTLG